MPSPLRRVIAVNQERAQKRFAPRIRSTVAERVGRHGYNPMILRVYGLTRTFLAVW